MKRQFNPAELEFLERHPADSHDSALCALALHVFSEDTAVRLLQRCGDLSHQFVLVSDLRRGFLAPIGVHLLTATVFREPMTKYDARLSAARAFSFLEMNQLARRAGWTTFRHETFPLARQAIWLS